MLLGPKKKIKTPKKEVPLLLEVQLAQAADKPPPGNTQKRVPETAGEQYAGTVKRS